MNKDEALRLKTSELPKILELVGPDGQTKVFELLLSKKDGFGVFINKVSTPLRKYFGRSK